MIGSQQQEKDSVERKPLTRSSLVYDDHDDCDGDPGLSCDFIGYLSNFATGFQKVPFFLKIDQNQWFQNSRFHFYLVFI